MAWHGEVLFFKVNMSEYYTVKEFAALLKVNPETIRNAIRSGKIIAIKPGGGKTSGLRIPQVELQRMAADLSYKTQNKERHEEGNVYD